jgi:hypothetical protein
MNEHEFATMMLEKAASEPDSAHLDQWDRVVRRARGRRRRRTAIRSLVLSIALLTAAGTVIAVRTDQSSLQTSGGERTADDRESTAPLTSPEPDTTRNENESNDLSVIIPAGWHVADDIYTPHMIDPREVLAAGSYPLPAQSGGGVACDAQVPSAPLDALPDDGVFIWVVTSGVDSERRNPIPGETKPPPPATFDIRALAVGSCGDHEIRFNWYEDSSTTFGVFIALGPQVPDQRVTQAEQLLDSITFDG